MNMKEITLKLGMPGFLQCLRELFTFCYSDCRGGEKCLTYHSMSVFHA